MTVRTKCLWTLVVAVTCGVIWLVGWGATESVSAQNSSAATCNVAGTWIGTSPNGNIFTETILPEPGGNRFQYMIEGLSNASDATFGGTFPEVGTVGLTLRGEAERIASNTYRFKSIVYGLVDNTPGQPNDYVYIRVDEGVVHFVDCDTQQAINNVSIYTADQDADRDGLPDPGEEPIIFIPDVPVEVKRFGLDS